MKRRLLFLLCLTRPVSVTLRAPAYNTVKTNRFERYSEPDAISNAIGYARFFSRSHDAVIEARSTAKRVIRESITSPHSTWRSQIPVCDLRFPDIFPRRCHSLLIVPAIPRGAWLKVCSIAQIEQLRSGKLNRNNASPSGSKCSALNRRS